MPDGAADLVADLYRRMPEARITDILLEVDDATRFTEAFTHLRTGEPCRDRIGLLKVLLAEGINLGLRKMAEATTTHGFWELMRIVRWHVEGDAFDRALAVVVEAQSALPMAAFWGTGRTASSDGQFFPAAGRGEALNLVNARYGADSCASSPRIRARTSWRRRCGKSAASNAVRDRVDHGHRREPASPGRLELGDAVFARRQAGLDVPAELLAHVSPLGWEHINLTGECRWPGADRRATRNA